MEVAVQKEGPGVGERKMVARMIRGVFRWQPPPRHTKILTSLSWDRVEFEGNTGARVAGRWFPAADARGTVVLAHPDRRAGQQWFLPKGYVEFLHEAGYNVLTFDFAGYGETRGGSTYLFEDVVAACQYARARTPNLPIHLLGVSIGAFSAANASPDLPWIGALILESPFPSFNAWYGRGLARFGMKVFDILFPRTSKLIQADKRIAQSNASRILVAAADADRITPARLSQKVALAAPSERSRFLRVRDADHLSLFETSSEFRGAILETLEAATQAQHFVLPCPGIGSPRM